MWRYSRSVSADGSTPPTSSTRTSAWCAPSASITSTGWAIRSNRSAARRPASFARGRPAVLGSGADARVGLAGDRGAWRAAVGAWPPVSRAVAWRSLGFRICRACICVTCRRRRWPACTRSGMRLPRWRPSSRRQFRRRAHPRSRLAGVARGARRGALPASAGRSRVDTRRGSQRARGRDLARQPAQIATRASHPGRLRHPRRQGHPWHCRRRWRARSTRWILATLAGPRAVSAEQTRCAIAGAGLDPCAHRRRGRSVPCWRVLPRAQAIACWCSARSSPSGQRSNSLGYSHAHGSASQATTDRRNHPGGAVRVAGPGVADRSARLASGHGDERATKDLHRYTIDLDAQTAPSSTPGAATNPPAVALPAVPSPEPGRSTLAAPGEAAAPESPAASQAPVSHAGKPPANPGVATSPPPNNVAAATPAQHLARPVRELKLHAPRVNHPSVARPPAGSFAVQLGTFGKRENADRLARDMTAKGFAAFVVPTTTNGHELLSRARGTNTRSCVGRGARRASSSGSASPAASCRFRDADAAVGCFRAWPSSTMPRLPEGIAARRIQPE